LIQKNSFYVWAGKQNPWQKGIKSDGHERNKKRVTFSSDMLYGKGNSFFNEIVLCKAISFNLDYLYSA